MTRLSYEKGKGKVEIKKEKENENKKRGEQSKSTNNKKLTKEVRKETKQKITKTEPKNNQITRGMRRLGKTHTHSHNQLPHTYKSPYIPSTLNLFLGLLVPGLTSPNPGEFILPTFRNKQIHKKGVFSTHLRSRRDVLT